MYDDYPAMLAGMMRAMFVVDGSPVQPVRKKMMAPVKQVGLRKVLKDVRRGVKAL